MESESANYLPGGRRFILDFIRNLATQMADSNKQLTSFFIEDILSLKEDKKDDFCNSENDRTDKRTGIAL